MIGIMLMGCIAVWGAPAESTSCLSPTALAATKDGKTVFVACATGNQVLRFDAVKREISGSIPMPQLPSGLVLSADDSRLYVTCAGPESQVCVVDLEQSKTVESENQTGGARPPRALLDAPRVQPSGRQPSPGFREPSDAPNVFREGAENGDRGGRAPQFNSGFRVETIPVGHTAMAPVPGPDGRLLYVCNRFNNDVSEIDLTKLKELFRIEVQREPVAAAITKDGKYLLVANHLHKGRADVAYVGAAVSVVDLAAGEAVKELQLPNGSGSLQDIRVSPDGKYAVVTHLVARHDRETSSINYGWMHVNALTLIDVGRMEIHNTVLLDSVNSGAANPWGVAWSADSTTLVVTHAGTHEVSIIDFPTLISHVLSLRRTVCAEGTADPNSVFSVRPELSDDLPFLAGARRRVKLPDGDLGPRSVVVVGHHAYVANYFSDTLSIIDLTSPGTKIESVPLGPKREMELVRRGEFYFHDASKCYQTWQSCSSCHPGGARADGLNWDLLNDGLGNPKNTKSLLLAHQTPPAMALGVRESAETAVRSGIRHILFAEASEEMAGAIDAYLKSLKPVPSPYLMHGKLSEAAERGKKVFTRAGCAECHPPGLFTDQRRHDVGTQNARDKPTDKFDTPSLIELWRTAPYLHDGSATTVRETVTIHNPDDKRGTTSKLSRDEIDDLCAYLLSL